MTKRIKFSILVTDELRAWTRGFLYRMWGDGMKQTGILLLHGFGGSTDEIAPLGRRLEERGYCVAMPLLAGHGAGSREMARAGSSDWIASADAAYQDLAGRVSRVAVIGFSMGGLVAVNLYARHRFDALITLNAPVWFWNWPQIVKNLRTEWVVYRKKYLGAFSGKPPRAMVSFLRLLLATRPLFDAVDCPALIVQMDDDDTVPPKSAGYLVGHFTGKTTVVRYPDGGHLAAHSRHIDAMVQEIDAFLSDLEENGKNMDTSLEN